MQPSFWAAVLNLFLIDLVLSGDNAVVIALAVHHLPPPLARRASLVGAVVAVVLRIVFAAMAAELLRVPWLQAAGGLVLYWVAFDLLGQEEQLPEAGRPVGSFKEAVRVIVVADLIMSLDNILAVGGASHGNLLLLAIGLALSIPFVLFGSTVLAGAMNRWPALGFVGAAIIAWTAGSMLASDPALASWIGRSPVPFLVEGTGTVLLLFAGFLLGRFRESHTGGS